MLWLLREEVNYIFKELIIYRQEYPTIHMEQDSEGAGSRVAECRAGFWSIWVYPSSESEKAMAPAWLKKKWQHVLWEKVDERFKSLIKVNLLELYTIKILKIHQMSIFPWEGLGRPSNYQSNKEYAGEQGNKLQWRVQRLLPSFILCYYTVWRDLSHLDTPQSITLMNSFMTSC